MTATVTFTESTFHSGYNNDCKRVTVKVELMCDGEDRYFMDEARKKALVEAHQLFAALVVRPKEKTP